MNTKAISIAKNEAGEEIKTVTPFGIESIAIRFQIQYRDLTDPNNPKQGNFLEETQVNFNETDDFDRKAATKAYMIKVLPHMVAEIVRGYDPTKAASKAIKAAIDEAIADALKV